MQLNLDGEIAAPHSPFASTPPSPPWRMVEAEDEEEEEQRPEEQGGAAAIAACTEAARGLSFRPYAMCKARKAFDNLAVVQQTYTEDPTPRRFLLVDWGVDGGGLVLPRRNGHSTCLNMGGRHSDTLDFEGSYGEWGGYSDTVTQWILEGS